MSGKVQRVRDFGKPSAKWNDLIVHLPPGLRELCRREYRKNVRDRRDDWHTGN